MVKHTRHLFPALHTLWSSHFSNETGSLMSTAIVKPWKLPPNFLQGKQAHVLLSHLPITSNQTLSILRIWGDSIYLQMTTVDNYRLQQKPREGPLGWGGREGTAKGDRRDRGDRGDRG